MQSGCSACKDGPRAHENLVGEWRALFPGGNYWEDVPRTWCSEAPPRSGHLKAKAGQMEVPTGIDHLGPLSDVPTIPKPLASDLMLPETGRPVRLTWSLALRQGLSPTHSLRCSL